MPEKKAAKPRQTPNLDYDPDKLEWLDGSPPAPVRQDRRHATAVVESLKQRPGQWAKLAGDAVSFDVQGFEKKYPGTQAQVRQDPASPGRRNVFVRWVGTDGDQSA